MTKHATICVGTLGQGIWRSSDGGDTWLRADTASIAKAPCAPWRCIPATLVSCTVARTAAYTAVRIKASAGAAGLAHERDPRLGPRH